MSFELGSRVRKVKGYPFEGKIVSSYSDNKYVVKHNDGWEHIFNGDQLYPYYQEFQYLDLLKDVLDNGVYREGRNGGTYGVFGRQMRFDLREGFPLLTTKKLHTKSIFGELLWFLSGSTNTKYLKENGITIWDEWEDENGDLGPVYGAQWRFWPDYRKAHFIESTLNPHDQASLWDCTTEGYYTFGTIDQIQNLLDNLKKDPCSRRHIISAWNPADIDSMALPPCHALFQFFVENGRLSCQLYQRSADLFLGVPFNIASYALLTHLIANEVGLEVGDFVHTLGDVHLYHNHIEQAKTQLERLPLEPPKISIVKKPIFEISLEDIQINNYVAHPSIKAEVSA